ncbi:hypothetical protein C8F01DRAFT_1092113 [Mycena amicta]|nr:hypothetical protein C8F01DRAFT_1092113 [Mycena amicta]
MGFILNTTAWAPSATFVRWTQDPASSSKRWRRAMVGVPRLSVGANFGSLFSISAGLSAMMSMGAGTDTDWQRGSRAGADGTKADGCDETGVGDKKGLGDSSPGQGLPDEEGWGDGKHAGDCIKSDFRPKASQLGMVWASDGDSLMKSDGSMGDWHAGIDRCGGTQLRGSGCSASSASLSETSGKVGEGWFDAVEARIEQQEVELFKKVETGHTCTQKHSGGEVHGSTTCLNWTARSGSAFSHSQILVNAVRTRSNAERGGTGP